MKEVIVFSGQGLYMGTKHTIIFGDCRNMREVPDASIHLMVTSPPYFNAPFDYPDLFPDYDDFLSMMRKFAQQLYRKMAPGRIATYVTDDMLVDGEKFPVVSDTTTIMRKAGFRYRDKIIWIKPKGYTRISRRSGVLLQHPYPMYYYPDNIQESILIFQKGKFDYKYLDSLSEKTKEDSRIDLSEYNSRDWYLTVWNITNVLPVKGRLEEGIAAFPEEIPERLIKLFTFTGENVLDPFLGSGTTMKVARRLGRNSWGYELDSELKHIILQKVGYTASSLTGDEFILKERKDARRLRGMIQERVSKQRSVVARAS